METSYLSRPPAPPHTAALSLHDALPIFCAGAVSTRRCRLAAPRQTIDRGAAVPEHERRSRAGILRRDRKSTRLNSSHVEISYAVFCLKKKKSPVSERHGAEFISGSVDRD